MTGPIAAGWEQLSEAAKRSLAQGDTAAAEASLRAALTDAERLGVASPAVATVLLALGQLRYQLGDVAESERMLTRALEIRERTLGPEHAETAVLLNALARVHFKKGDFPQADRLLLRLLKIRQQLGAEHPEVANVLASLATLRQSLGKYDAAEQLWRRVVTIREQAFPNDVALALALEGLADVLSPQGNREEALALRERAIAIRERALGADHPSLSAARARATELKLRIEQDRPFGGAPPAAAPIASPSIAPVSDAVTTLSPDIGAGARHTSGIGLAFGPPPPRPSGAIQRPDARGSGAFSPPTRPAAPSRPSASAPARPSTAVPRRDTGARSAERPRYPQRRPTTTVASPGSGIGKKLFVSLVVVAAVGGTGWIVSRHRTPATSDSSAVFPGGTIVPATSLPTSSPPTAATSGAPHEPVALAPGARTGTPAGAPRLTTAPTSFAEHPAGVPDSARTPSAGDSTAVPIVVPTINVKAIDVGNVAPPRADSARAHRDSSAHAATKSARPDSAAHPPDAAR